MKKKGLRLPLLTDAGQRTSVYLDATTTSLLDILPYDPLRFFTRPVGTVDLPLSKLIASRARPAGIINANRKMLEAYNRVRMRRPPLTVRPLKGSRWIVIDGNSTLANAFYSRWPDIPCCPED